MSKSVNTPKKPQTGGGSNKGDGGRKPPSNPQTPTQQPGKSRGNEGAPGIKPPKGA